MKKMNKVIRTLFWAMVLVVPSILYSKDQYKFTFKNQTEDTIQLKVRERQGVTKKCPGKSHILTLGPKNTQELKTDCCILNVDCFYYPTSYPVWTAVALAFFKCKGVGVITKDKEGKYQLKWEK